MWKALFSSGEPEIPEMKNEVTLKVNGKAVTVGSGDVAATTSLNTFVRDHLKLTGTKFNCGEGTCGACIVVATVEHPVTKEKQTISVNSCLVPVLSCQGWEVTTIEGVGNRKDNYHQVQTQLAEFNGTQCGFCSPGFVMNMFGMLGDEKKPTMAEVEDAFGSNICRCTGYRSILEAYKAMASDAPPKMQKRCADIEDLYKTCSKTGKPCAGDCKKIDTTQPIKVSLGAETWHRVTSIDGLFETFGQIGDEKYKLVAGNTAEGVHRSSGVTRFIDVRDVPELRGVETSPVFLLGANATLTETVHALRAQAATAGYGYLNDVAAYWAQIASVPIRNIGTIAGNLALKKEYPAFVSDVFTVLEAIGATLHILTGVGKVVKVSPSGFQGYDMTKKVVRGVELPPLDDSYVLRFLHVLPRSQSAIAQVNAAFVVQRGSSSTWDVTSKPRLVFGGVGGAFVHAVATETFLQGKNLLDSATVSQAVNILNGEIRPEEAKPGASADHRRKAAVALFYRFLLGLDPEKVTPEKKSGGQTLTRDLSSSHQDFDTNASVHPLNEPIPKIEALPQCSGETQYTADIPERPDELHAALVLTKQSTGTITGYDSEAALAVPGAIAFYTAADLDGRPNSFTPPDVLSFVEDEEIFCGGTVKYAGQAVGVVVAENRIAALQAAALVVIKYAQNPTKPVLSTKEPTKEKLFPIKDDLAGKELPKSDFNLKGTFEIGNQYPLYMENLSCIVVPTEDGYDVHSSTQWMDLDQIVVARTVGVPVNKVNVFVKRIGGGFGGKQSRSGILASACAVAAKKQNRPVRMVLPLSTNMEVTSKRFAQRNEYQVGFTAEGKIEYAIVDVFQDSGCTHNESPMPIFEAFFNSCYGTRGYKIQGHEILTSKASNGPIRGPGPIEGVAFHDEIMERIAVTLKKDPLEIKLLNMEKLDSPLPNMIKDLQEKADYAKRRADIDAFNQQNRWKKRGMSVTPMRYPFAMWNHLTSTVSIYHGDGSIGIAHGGIEMGQGLNTKVSQVAAHIMGLKIDQISIKPSSTTNGANCKMSGGGIISEGVAYATIKACQILLERLEPVKATMNNPTWPQLIQEAYNRDVNLTAQYLFSKEQPDIKDYNIWAVCISEVEVDVLTGEKQIRRVDLLEDVGQSLSPLIDVGQIEGAFMMGLGYWLLEDMNFDPDTGRLLENRLWHYPAPGAKDIPVDFRVYLRKNAPNPLGVLGSKSTGEPAICLSVNVWFAIRNALQSARKDAGGNPDYFDLKHPANNENILAASLTSPQQFTF